MPTSQHVRLHKRLASLKGPFTHFLDEVFIKSWWVVLFILACYFFYEQGLRRKDREHAFLQNQYSELVQKKKSVKKQQLELRREINGQSDKASLELILIKEMGLVPEGQTKVVFKKQGT